nr:MULTISPECIES: TatD family hydrolase [unclassified Oceanispirochaeta]
MTIQKLISSCHFIDAHSHSDDYPNRDAMLREVKKNKILTLNSAVDPESIKAAAAMNKICPWILTASGIHPWNAGKYSPETVESLENEYKSAMHISEIGMDSVWAPQEADIKKQEALMESQLSMALKYNKPVTLHTKGAEQQVLTQLKSIRPPSTLIHWFDGSETQLKEYMNLDCFFTVSPAVFTDRKFRSLIKKIPLNRLLPETDNPGTWSWLFGEDGHPLQIQNVIKESASFLNCDEDELLLCYKENLKAFLLL